MSLFGKQLDKDILLAGSYKADIAKKCDAGKSYIGNLCKGSDKNRDYIPSEEMLLKLANAMPKANINLWRKLIELDRLNKKCPGIVQELLQAVDPHTDRKTLELRDLKIITALIHQAIKE